MPNVIHTRCSDRVGNLEPVLRQIGADLEKTIGDSAASSVTLDWGQSLDGIVACTLRIKDCAETAVAGFALHDLMDGRAVRQRLAQLYHGLNELEQTLAANKRPDVVSASFAAGQPDHEGRQRIEATLTIARDWLIYANPILDPITRPLEARLSICDAQGTELLRTIYPEGELIPNKMLKHGGYRVYRKKVVFTMEVQRPTVDRQPVEIEAFVYVQNAAGLITGHMLTFRQRIP